MFAYVDTYFFKYAVAFILLFLDDFLKRPLAKAWKGCQARHRYSLLSQSQMFNFHSCGFKLHESRSSLSNLFE